jgi:mRNA-degrading endonuclease RelE of RelBE toxin-antitoxin system
MSSPIRKILDEAQKQILDEAQKLPKQDRALLRAELQELDEDVPQDEVDAAWEGEIEKRLAANKLRAISVIAPHIGEATAC